MAPVAHASRVRLSNQQHSAKNSTWDALFAHHRQRLVERDDRRLAGDLDRDLFGEILGLSGGVSNHRGDRLATIVDALMGEDRLRYRDIIRPIGARTDRLDIADEGPGYDWHFGRRLHPQEFRRAASRWQSDLADALGVNPSTVQRWTSGDEEL